MADQSSATGQATNNWTYTQWQEYYKQQNAAYSAYNQQFYGMYGQPSMSGAATQPGTGYSGSMMQPSAPGTTAPVTPPANYATLYGQYQQALMNYNQQQTALQQYILKQQQLQADLVKQQEIAKMPLMPQQLNDVQKKLMEIQTQAQQLSTQQQTVVASMQRSQQEMQQIQVQMQTAPGRPTQTTSHPWGTLTPTQQKTAPVPSVVSPPVRFTIATKPTPSAYSRPTPVSVPPSTVSSTPVTTQQQQQQPKGNPASAPTQQQQFPPRMKEFVEKCFARCTEENERAAMEVYLKTRITSAITKGQVWLIDWASQPAPDPKAVVQVHGPSAAKTADQPPTPTKSPWKRDAAMESKAGKKGGRRRRSSSSDSEPDMKEKKGKKKEPANKIKWDLPDRHEVDKRAKRGNRFADTLKATRPVFRDDDENEENELDWDSMTVKGTSTALEKQYLRLTSAPDPSTVRPQPILEKSLAMIKEKWRNEKCEYLYACEQLKSIRQDLTVQRIRNEFTVEVYETHARIAIEKTDLPEFNQCQSQLRNLFSEGIPGHIEEFLAYRLFYHVYTASHVDFLRTFQELSPDMKKKPAILHAIKVGEAIRDGNFYKFFKQYEKAPNMSGYFMDLMAERVRMTALRVICKSYRPSIPFKYIQKTLGIESDVEFVKFQKTKGLTAVREDPQLMDTKETLTAIIELERQLEEELKQKSSNRRADIVHVTM